MSTAKKKVSFDTDKEPVEVSPEDFLVDVYIEIDNHDYETSDLYKKALACQEITQTHLLNGTLQDDLCKAFFNTSEYEKLENFGEGRIPGWNDGILGLKGPLIYSEIVDYAVKYFKYFIFGLLIGVQISQKDFNGYSFKNFEKSRTTTSGYYLIFSKPQRENIVMFIEMIPFERWWSSDQAKQKLIDNIIYIGADYESGTEIRYLKNMPIREIDKKYMELTFR